MVSSEGGGQWRKASVGQGPRANRRRPEGCRTGGYFAVKRAGQVNPWDLSHLH